MTSVVVEHIFHNWDGVHGLVVLDLGPQQAAIRVVIDDPASAESIEEARGRAYAQLKE